MEFVKKAMIRIERHCMHCDIWKVDYGCGTWSEFVLHAEGENQREKKQAERKRIVTKYGQ